MCIVHCGTTLASVVHGTTTSRSIVHCNTAKTRVFEDTLNVCSNLVLGVMLAEVLAMNLDAASD
jgi:hypothetical protein